MSRPRKYTRPATATQTTPVELEPLTGNIEDEQGWQLAELRQLHIHNRYSLGAPTMSLNVMRSSLPTLRAGDWVLLDLSWFPDYVTQRRGLVGLAQVVALGDLDCAWRRLLLEQVTPLESGS